MKGIVCKVCYYVVINGVVPQQCPVCGAKSFEEKDDALKTAADKAEVGESEKKHIPAITVIKKCGLISEECQDVHVKIGEIQHPMTPEHSIQHIDFYIDKEFISRVILTPDKLNPAAVLHLKLGAGKIAAVELCNLHGAWFNETDL
ncbi:MAG: desulfoferrodoxin family protein [Candidatus Kaelpia imicola]|nr:desulfoferrodoxin family protein [Candidatus Kaelpia imicola]